MPSLAIGVVQQAVAPDLAANRDKIVRFVSQAGARGCRIAVFPESALYSPAGTPKAEIDAAVAAVQGAAREAGIYVMFGSKYRRTDEAPPVERLWVIGPDGGVIQRYDKISHPGGQTDLPGLFAVDGVPCSAAICSDRWIRGVDDLPAVQSAQILIECSGNYAAEWIPDLGWYWYAPRAQRNGVYVVFANSSNHNPGSAHPHGHGHSAIFAPDGRCVIAAGGEADRLLVATVDPSRATRGEALRRRDHPLLAPFWAAGLPLLDGRHAVGGGDGGDSGDTPLERLVSPAVTLTIAAAQMACSADAPANVARMERMIRAAGAAGAGVVVFPELAVTGATDEDIRRASAETLNAALCRLQEIAARERIMVAFGMPALDGERRENCAYVLGADGALLTRYAQLVPDRPALFAAGTNTRSMWFEAKGVPAVVTIGRDALWSEIAELAAARGAQVHLHLCYDRDTRAEATTWRRQLWVNLASFRTFTATVNAASPAVLPRPSAPANGGSALWEDFHRFSSGQASGFEPYSAVRLAEAGAEEAVLYATQAVPATNPQFDVATRKGQPHLSAWYVAGLRAIAGNVEVNV